VGPASPLIMMVLMFVVFWFLLIRPQVKRQKQHQAMLQSLKKGDMVVTRGGLVGKISGVSDTILTIELQEKVRVRVLRSHVDGQYAEPGADKSTQETSKAA
jgi:preprotein translocase subunit YajC